MEYNGPVYGRVIRQTTD